MVEATGFKRKLAVIVAAEVEGFSQLMGADKDATLKTLSYCSPAGRYHLGNVWLHGGLSDETTRVWFVAPTTGMDPFASMVSGPHSCGHRLG